MEAAIEPTFALVMSFRSLYTRASVMCTSIVSDLSSMPGELAEQEAAQIQRVAILFVLALNESMD